MITSRYPDWRELAAPLAVDVFDHSESISLLRQWLPRLTEDEAGRIAEAVGNLPLALTQAGAYLHDTGLASEAYLALLAERASVILAQGRPVTYPRTVGCQSAAGFRPAGGRGPGCVEAAGSGRAAGARADPFHPVHRPPHRLPEPLAAVAADPVAFAGLTGLVRRRALAGVDPESLQLHRLMQAILRDRPISALGRSVIRAQAPHAPPTPTNEGDMSTVVRRLLREAVPADPWNNPASWPAWRQLLPHVLAVTDATPTTDSGDVAWLLGRAAIYLQTQGEPRPARALYERAHQLCRDRLGEDHPDTLASANNLALDLHALGEHQQARTLDEDTLTRYRRVLGEDHPDTLISATNLAVDLRALGEYQQARTLNEDTLTRSRRVLGDDHPNTLISANNLALRPVWLGEYQQARTLNEDTLTRRRRVLGEDHPDTLTSANNLAAQPARAG